jgi:glycosyltransferase involved in cell wall biosynthesis
VRILLAHDFYRSSAPSGEDTVYANERALLESRGHEVIPFERRNDEIDDSTLGRRMRLAIETGWSAQSYRELSSLLRGTRPDVAHFHNTFPLISPSAYAACHEHGVPVVQTLHNFRLVCANALLLREGRACEDCIGGTLLPALRHRCYRGSFAATGAVVWMLSINRLRGTYARRVNRYIALTNFAAGRLIAGGLPQERMAVKPNFLPEPPPAGTGRGGYAVYVGRLTAEKGVRTLLQAWAQGAPLPLKIIGDGELRGELERRARGLPVEFLGFLRREAILAIVGKAEVLVLPSECYEGFPMVVAESYAAGTPIAASRIGSVDEVVFEGETGVKFEPGNAVDLAAKLKRLVSDASLRGAMRRRARATFEERYTAEINYRRLIEIYGEAIEDAAREAGR